MEYVFLLGVAGAVWWWWSKRRERFKQLARAAVEQRCLQMLQKFPDADDETLATFVRDDILNERAPALLLEWAVPETAARMRRTVLRQILEEGQAPKKKKTKQLG